MYFKITNKNENHHGFQYVDGLNILTDDFNPNGSCVKGGLYFTTKEYIARFLNYGVYLREILLPTDDPDFRMVRDPAHDKWRANKIILGKKWLLSDTKTFEYLIEIGAININTHNMVIEWAFTRDYTEIIQLLFDHGADANTHNGNYFHRAIRRGNINMVMLFLKYGVNIHEFNEAALRMAIEKKNLVIAKILIDKGADIYVNNFKNLIVASSNNSLDILMLLIEISGDKISNYKKIIEKALKEASLRGHFEIVQVLIKFVERYDKSLIRACFNGHLSIAKLLVDNGANPRYDNDLPLLITCYTNHVEIIDYLVEKGADIHINNEYPLKIACRYHKLQSIKKLFDLGANVNPLNVTHAHPNIKFVEKLINPAIVISTKYDVPIIMACNNGISFRFSRRANVEDTIIFLVEKGAEISKEVIIFLCRENYLSVVDFLIKKYIDVNFDNDLMLITASCHGRYELVKILVNNGANVQTKSNQALVKAIKNHHLDVANYLISHGAPVDEYVKNKMASLLQPRFNPFD